VKAEGRKGNNTWYGMAWHGAGTRWKGQCVVGSVTGGSGSSRCARQWQAHGMAAAMCWYSKV